MKLITRTVAGLALGALGVLAAVGVYTEVTHVPDQP
jgi:hypothetical protein